MPPRLIFTYLILPYAMLAHFILAHLMLTHLMFTHLMFSQEENRAPQLRPPRQTIHPRHRVFAVVMRHDQLKALIQIGGDMLNAPDAGAADGFQPQGHIEDDSGEPHAGAGGVEQRGVVGGAAPLDLAACEHQGQFRHMVAETPHLMMILAVNIRRHRPAYGHETGARQHRQEPSPRRDEFQHLAKPQPRRTTQDARLLVEVDEPVQPAAVDDAPRQRAVAVTASAALHRKGIAPRQRRQIPGQGRVILRFENLGVQPWVASPTVNLCSRRSLPLHSQLFFRLC